uniref:Uncharacterized protein n=1 Tax=Solanum lycopersicum TaxID=4081 RepID=A0A3Q7GFF2_SOLLC
MWKTNQVIQQRPIWIKRNDQLTGPITSYKDLFPFNSNAFLLLSNKKNKPAKSRNRPELQSSESSEQ